MDPTELHKLAVDIYKGLVFTDRHVGSGEHRIIPMIFIPLALMREKVRDDFIAADPGLIYEYLSEAGPRSINGYPQFFSVRHLSKPDAAIVLDKVAKLQEREAREMESIKTESDE